MAFVSATAEMTKSRPALCVKEGNAKTNLMYKPERKLHTSY